MHTDGPIIGAGTLTLASNGTMPFLGVDISPLGFQAETMDQGILRVKIGAPGRWEVPQDGLFTNTVKGMIQQLPCLLLCPDVSANPFCCNCNMHMDLHMPLSNSACMCRNHAAWLLQGWHIDSFYLLFREHGRFAFARAQVQCISLWLCCRSKQGQ